MELFSVLSYENASTYDILINAARDKAKRGRYCKKNQTSLNRLDKVFFEVINMNYNNNNNSSDRQPRRNIFEYDKLYS